MAMPRGSSGQECDEHRARGVCEDCDGRGWGWEYCICNGSGEGYHDGSICRTCRGRGERATECDACDGTGEIVEVHQDGDE